MTENSILAQLAYHPEGGALHFQGVRYLLLRPETLASLQKRLETNLGPEKTGELLYEGGFTGGQLSGQKYKQIMKLDDHEAVAFMCQMGSEIGWGHFRLIELNTDKPRLVVEVDRSPFAEAYGEKSEGGVCHFIRGVLGGLTNGIFRSEVRADEPLCLSKGDALCRFETEGLP